MGEETKSTETYNLGRDTLASVRLDLQHFLWKETLGFKLHSSIPKDQPDLKIADVGTGTGIWLLELAKELPSTVKFTGFDLSDLQFPSADWVPQNVSFEAQDASKPPPAHLVGQFDVVHLRLFQLVVADDDPAPYIEHCMSLLKPGGYLQWDEYNPETIGIIRSKESSSATVITTIAKHLVANRRLSWITKLPGHFLTHGLESVSSFNAGAPDHLLKAFTEMIYVANMEYASILEAKGQIADAEKTRELIKQGAKEVQDGVYFRHVLQIVVGRKAENRRFWSQV